MRFTDFGFFMKVSFFDKILKKSIKNGKINSGAYNQVYRVQRYQKIARSDGCSTSCPGGNQVDGLPPVVSAWLPILFFFEKSIWMMLGNIIDDSKKQMCEMYRHLIFY